MNESYAPFTFTEDLPPQMPSLPQNEGTHCSDEAPVLGHCPMCHNKYSITVDSDDVIFVIGAALAIYILAMRK
jgi:hypothetical protein